MKVLDCFRTLVWTVTEKFFTMSLKIPGLMRVDSFAVWKMSTEPSASSWRVRDSSEQKVPAVTPPTLEKKKFKLINPYFLVFQIPIFKWKSYSSWTTIGPSFVVLSFLTRLRSSKVLLTGLSGFGQQGAR